VRGESGSRWTLSRWKRLEIGSKELIGQELRMRWPLTPLAIQTRLLDPLPWSAFSSSVIPHLLAEAFALYRVSSPCAGCG